MLKVNHLSKVYGVNESKIYALNQMNLSVEDNSFTAIVGTSGSGKSTLLHILGGIDKPIEGNVYFDDTGIYSLSEKKTCSIQVKSDWIYLSIFWTDSRVNCL